MDAIILAHGGAGDIPDSRVEPKVNNFARFIESVKFLTYFMFYVFVFFMAEDRAPRWDIIYANLVKLGLSEGARILG